MDTWKKGNGENHSSGRIEEIISAVSRIESRISLWGKALNLNPAIGKFTGDARHQGRRRINILQAVDNDADSVNVPIPHGKGMKRKMISSG